MSSPLATTIPARTQQRSDPRDLRRTWRVLLAVAAPLGAAAIAVSRVVAPYDTTDDTGTVFERVAADLGAARLTLWLGAVAVLFLLPGVVAVAMVTRRRAPLLTTWAAGLSFLAFSAGLASPTIDSIALAAAEEGGTVEAVRLVEAMASQPAAGTLLGSFVLGHIVGTVLLGLALVRSRAVPIWAGVALAVSQPVHLLSFMTGLGWLDLVAGWGFTTVGFAAASVALLRMRDDDFDLPPVATRR